ncbi:MAG: helix-turn-helix domain-containing protein, partial [Chlorobi bacterium]|nr:helix-turn-helix domain-containing protein [Chlorobiota bacterium]
MKSLGHILKKSREAIGLSIAQASEKTKIRPYLIEAFEKDDFAILPGVYAKSFIKTYAEFLNISYADIEESVNELFKPAKPVVELENPALNETREPVISGKPISKTNAFKKYLTDDSGTNLVNYLVYIGLT